MRLLDEMAIVTVVVVNWNTRELLAGCLTSVIGLQSPVSSGGGEDPASELVNLQTVTGDRQPPGVEVIVVDNASTDGSAGMVQTYFPCVKLIKNAENVGFARASNQGIQQSKGRYVVLLNSDTEVLPGAVETMVAFMDEHPEAASCGPRLVNADGSLQASCHPMLTPEREFWRLAFLDRIWRRATYNQEQWDPTRAHRVEVIKGACLLLRREALAQVGPLDEEYFMYSEEMDLCYRLARTGWQLWWVPQAIVKHYGEASSRQVPETMYLELYRSKIQFYRKTGGERRAARFKHLVYLAYWPRLVLAVSGAALSSSRAAQARTYRRLLTELPGM